ncbi:alpha/beta fold hydrolase [Teredinibacter waterburyi]|uniref:alpha/beta fold hydrolase n=1 Tax=Teredinibacter waterburyi TaxID=1500538 RepID=UPI00165F91CF|nr:alpha/beta fold hydrolase [Teredinibacter waterburyi]
MIKSDVIVITGATGFLSSHLLLTLVYKYKKIYAIVRGEDSKSANARLMKKLDEASESSYSAPDFEKWERVIQVLSGDVTLPNFGISESDFSLLASEKPSAIWHFAGSLKYEEKFREDIFRCNVEGTRLCLNATKQLKIPNFYYVSTAFVVGQKLGPCTETLSDTGGEFNNPYEESKCIAEHLVVDYCDTENICYKIVRPGIVVGPSTSLRTGGSDTGLYGFVAILNRTRDALLGLDHNPTLIGDETTPVHISPVDYFVDDIIHLIETNFSGGDIFHTLCETSIFANDLADAFHLQIGIPRFKLEETYDGSPSPIEQMYNKVMKMYGVACRYPKTFVRSLPAQESISKDKLQGYITECLSDITRRKKGVTWKRDSVVAFDDTILTCYCIDDAPDVTRETVVLVNAFGMINDIWTSLVKELRQNYKIVTWDTRGIPSLTEKFDENNCNIDAHVADMERVLSFYAVERAHAIGWCTGAQVSLKFSHLNSGRLLSFVSLNGAYSFYDDVSITDFKRNIMHLMPKVASSRAHAEAYHRMMYGNKTSEVSSSNKDVELDREKVESTISSSEELVVNMTTAPFRTAESLYRYAHLVMHLIKEPKHAWADGLTCRSLVLSGGNDTVAHPQESQEIARRIPHSKLVLDPNEDHFSVYHSSTYRQHIIDFLGEHTDNNRETYTKEVCPELM